MEKCNICDSHMGCDNCYWGQIETKTLNAHCEDCWSTITHALTEWRPLGDKFCRNCGRKLVKENKL